MGAAKADITPTAWPVAEAAYGIGRMAVGAAHPFYARSMAIQSCTNGRVIVLTALDSQGYFSAYKEDPGAGAAGFGSTAIRQIVQRDTGVAVGNLLIAATHTHNSPDSVGVWDGGSTANNKAPYLSSVKAQTVVAIETALARMRPAQLRVGSADVSALLSTYDQVRRDPVDYPTDHTLRVLQATDARTCAPIATLVNAGIHADVAGPIDEGHGQLIDPDWPGRVATVLERQLPGDQAVVMAGAVGRTGPSFPSGTDPNSHDQLVEVAAYGDVMARRVGAALASSQSLAAGPVEAIDAHLPEELGEPALIPLFEDETGFPGQLGGVMRSVLPPYATGTVLDAELQTFRVGPLLLAGAPGEAYPEVATELAKRVRTTSPPFVFGLANDQLGYTPPAFEYPVVALVDGGDEGFFTINSHFGDDIINHHLDAANALGFQARRPYDGATAGPVNPPDQQNPPPQSNNPSEPRELPLSLRCPAAPGGGSVAIPTTTTMKANGTTIITGGGGSLSLPAAARGARACVDARRLTIYLRRGRGVRVLYAAVTVNGRRVPVRFGRRGSAAAAFRGFSARNLHVLVVLRVSTHGRATTLRAARTYRTCPKHKQVARRDQH
ncbi:MAG: hypothetical protein ACR2JH_01355 [Solirubrobacteraceae bacterium]